MLEFAVVVIGAITIIGVINEVAHYLAHRQEERYEAASKGRLLEELRRQR